MMNEHELDLALERLVTEHKGMPAPPALYERVWAIPTTTPPVRRLVSWSSGNPSASFFRALGLLVGAAIVALAGGLLFSAAQPSPEPDVPVPSPSASATPRATVVASPSPAVTNAPSAPPEALVRGDLLPGVDLEVIQVGPGAYRVLGDGVRSLTPLGFEMIASGRDGSIWLYSSEGAMRLGRTSALERPITAPWFRVAPDGTVWIIGTEPDVDKPVVSSFDGAGWRVHPLPDGAEPTDLDVSADGTVWVSWPDPELDDLSRVAYFEDGGWHEIGAPAQVGSLVVTDAGDLWSQDYGVRVNGPSAGITDEVRAGRGGTVWVIGYTDEGGLTLSRRVGDTRERCPMDDAPEGFLPALGLAVASDGGLWGRYTARSEGVLPINALVRFDCQTWSYPLPGQDVLSSPQQVVITDNGLAWVVTRPPHLINGPAPGGNREARLYLITPDAFSAGVPTPRPSEDP